MKNLLLKPHPYKNVNAKGIREFIYSVVEDGQNIASWHEDSERDYVGAVVRQYISGKHVGYVCDPFKAEPDNVPADVYAIARLETYFDRYVGIDERGIIA